MQHQTASTSVKTSHLKEVPFYSMERRKFFLKSFVPRLICEIVVVLLLFVLFLLLILLWPKMRGGIENFAVSKTRLSPDSTGFEVWLNPPVKTIRSYRLFDILNHLDLMSKSANPEIQIRETLPLTYEVKVKRNNVEWLEDDTKVRYSLERFFTRHGDFDEILLNQHGAFVDILRAMFRTRYERIADNLFYVLGGNNAFNYSKAIDKVEGFVSPLFAAISARMQGPNRDRYGFIYRYNGSNGFNVTIHSGLHNSSIKGKFVDFSSEYTPFTAKAEQWGSDLFDGTTYPTLGNPPNRLVLNLFQPDFCKPVQLRYNRTVSILGFEHIHEYVLKLIDPEVCPQMDENCPEVDRIDVTRCFSNELPANTLLLTKPHLYGHSSTWTNVAFEPNGDKHESTVYFEPVTGTPISARTRIQLNVNTSIDRIKINEDGSSEPLRTRSVQRIIPMFWIDQTVDLNEATLQKLKFAATIMNKGEQVHQSFSIFYLFIMLFTLILIVALIEIFCWKRKSRKLKISSERQQSGTKIFVPTYGRPGESVAQPNDQLVTSISLTPKELI